MTQGSDAHAIVSAVSMLGRSLGMATTAGGVETHQQLQAARSAGCTEIQGYLFSRPGPAADIARLIGTAEPHAPTGSATPQRVSACSSV